MRVLLALASMCAAAGCKQPTQAYSSVMVVNGNVITTQAQAQRYAQGAYGVQMVYQNAQGDIKQQEATGFFTDRKGTTFITNGHVNDLKPPPGYELKSRTIVDYQGNVVQNVPTNVETYVNPGASTHADRDLAMWRFPDGTENLPHGTAQFAAKGYDLEDQKLRLAGYGVNTNSSTETPEYQKMRYGDIGGKLSNPTGNTWGYYGPRLDSDTGRTVSSAPGDSGAPIYGTDGSIVSINRGGKNVDADSSYSEAINPYGPGASSFFNTVRERGGVVDGWNDGSGTTAPGPAPAPAPEYMGDSDGSSSESNGDSTEPLISPASPTDQSFDGSTYSE